MHSIYPRMGIIGTGVFASTQAEVLNKVADMPIVYGVAGRSKEKSLDFASKFNVSKVYDSYKDLLNDKNIEVVFITVPNFLHKEIFTEALTHNKHIILEKPAALSSKDINEMIIKSKGYKSLIIVDHVLRFNPVTLKIKELIKNNTLGKVSFIQMSQYTNYGSDPDNPYRWYDQKDKGGGQVLNMGTHMIDFARFLLDMPVLKNGNLIKQTILDKKTDPRGVVRKVDVEEQFNANVIFENGVNLNFFNTLYSFGYKNFELKIIGSKGILLFDDINGLRFSNANVQELQSVTLDDPLENIKLGRSFVSKSFKYFAKDLLDYLAHKIDETNFNYCTLDEAKENLEILEKLDLERS